MDPEEHALLTFANTHTAMKAQEILEKADDAGQRTDIIIMPVPTSISAGCGIALKLPAECIKDAYGSLMLNGISQELTDAYVFRKGSGMYGGAYEKLFFDTV